MPNHEPLTLSPKPPVTQTKPYSPATPPQSPTTSPSSPGVRPSAHWQTSHHTANIKVCTNIRNSRLGKVFMNPKVAKLINQFQENHGEEAIITLWEDFQPLVFSCMRKFYITVSQREDIRQDAFIQLFECANTYDPLQGVPFESYFKMHLHYWFLNRIRKKTELLVIDHDWESGCSMTDLMESTMGNAPEAAETNETRKAIEDALQVLTKKQHQAVTLFYLQGIPLTQISKQMGCSYKVAYKHKEAGLKKIRNLLRTQ